MEGRLRHSAAANFNDYLASHHAQDRVAVLRGRQGRRRSGRRADARHRRDGEPRGSRWDSLFRWSTTCSTSWDRRKKSASRSAPICARAFLRCRSCSACRAQSRAETDCCKKDGRDGPARSSSAHLRLLREPDLDRRGARDGRDQVKIARDILLASCVRRISRQPDRDYRRTDRPRSLKRSVIRRIDLMLTA